MSGTYFVETGFWSGRAVVAGLQVGALSTVLIAINNLRDQREDSANAKKTLAVRFGVRFVRLEIATLCAFALLAAGAYWWTRAPLAAALPVLATPLAMRLVKNVFREEPSRAFNRFLGQAAALHLLFGFLFSVASWGKHYGIRHWYSLYELSPRYSLSAQVTKTTRQGALLRMGAGYADCPSVARVGRRPALRTAQTFGRGPAHFHHQTLARLRARGRPGPPGAEKFVC